MNGRMGRCSMNLFEAFLMAAAVAIAYLFSIGEKVIHVDLSGLLPKNSKSAKRRRLLVKCDTPLQGEKLHSEIRKVFEKVMIPLWKSDKQLLPARMDRNFRRKIERQIDSLSRRKLYREIRVADVVPLPQNGFKRWSDDGREWRESVLQCSALERFVSTVNGRPIQEIYRKNAFLRILQSRHVRNSDRTQKKENYYADSVTINCPSCGAQVTLDSQQTVCPYCGGILQSDFYDWQTEAFEIYEQMGTNLRNALLLLASAGILFACVFFCLWLIRNTMVSLAAGVGVAVLVTVAILAIAVYRTMRQEKMVGQIVRYSENYLRSCIIEVLDRKAYSSDLMDYSVGTILLKKVVNTEETTTITVKVYISETYLPERKRPYTRKYKRTLTLQRARYPKRRKGDGKFFVEKECPSCGANFIPDANHCCSFCGYGLQVVNSKWIVQAVDK